MNEGKEGRLQRLTAAQEAAAASSTASEALSTTSEPAGTKKKPKMAPRKKEVLERCAIAGLNQIKKSASEASSSFRGVPSYIGSAVAIWDQKSDLV